MKFRLHSIVKFKNYTYYQFTLLFYIVTVVLTSSVMAAPLPTGAGQLIQSLKNQPNLNQPGSADLLAIPKPIADQSDNNGDVSVSVNEFEITGNTIFSHVELSALVAELVGSKHTFGEINAGVAKITNWYRQHGYLVARAFLPLQDLKDGIVEIKVLEGRLGTQLVNNSAQISDANINKYLDKVTIGSPLQSLAVDRAVLLLTDTPGIGGARASLQPGASVGASDLVIQVYQGPAYSANIELDNFGSYYTGENRLGVALALNNPLKIGDQLTVRALGSDKNMSYGRISYQFPVGGNGLRLGVAYSDMRYQLGGEYEILDVHGAASSSSAFVTYPFIRSQYTNLYGTLTLERKCLSDIQPAHIDKKVGLINFGLTGSRQDAMWSGGMNLMDVSVVAGSLSMDAASLATDATTAKSNGEFSKLNIALNRLQRITDDNTLSIALSNQQASKNLNSSEKFYLGGANGVRAYPQSEAGGDQGWMLNAEIRHSFMSNLQGLIFYDAGSVKINQEAYILNTVNHRSISGAGLGLNAQYKSLQIKATLAWRLYGGAATTEPVITNSTPTFWVQLSESF